ncbi:unnamed protein product, partial [Nesidiocoris tenuis]
MKVIKNRLNGEFDGIKRFAELKRWIADTYFQTWVKSDSKGTSEAVTVEEKFWSFDHHHLKERNLFLIWRIDAVSLCYLRWDQEPGDSPCQSSGFWTGSLGCIHMFFVPYPQGQG